MAINYFAIILDGIDDRDLESAWIEYFTEDPGRKKSIRFTWDAFSRFHSGIEQLVDAFPFRSDEPLPFEYIQMIGEGTIRNQQWFHDLGIRRPWIRFDESHDSSSIEILQDLTPVKACQEG